MDTKSLTNYDLTIKQIDEFIDSAVLENTLELTLTSCRLRLRAIDMIQATIGNTDLLKEDFSFYSAALNHYASLIRERMFNIIRYGHVEN